MSIKKIHITYIMPLLILSQLHSLQAGEHYKTTVDAKKWFYPTVACVGALGFAITMLYNYYSGKPKANNRKTNTQTIGNIRGNGIKITQNGGSEAIQTISGLSNGIMKVNGHVVPPIGEEMNIKQMNNIAYINGQKVDFIQPIGENIHKQFSLGYSTIDVPYDLASVTRDNNITENQVEIEIDKAFADDVEIQNENGTLQLHFIPRVPPRGYYVGDNILAKIFVKKNCTFQDAIPK